MSAGCCAVGVVVECSAEAVLEAVPQPWKHVVAVLSWLSVLGFELHSRKQVTEID